MERMRWWGEEKQSNEEEKKETKEREDGNGIRDSVLAPDTRILIHLHAAQLFFLYWISLTHIMHTTSYHTVGWDGRQASHCCCFWRLDHRMVCDASDRFWDDAISHWEKALPFYLLSVLPDLIHSSLSFFLFLLLILIPSPSLLFPCEMMPGTRGCDYRNRSLSAYR